MSTNGVSLIKKIGEFSEHRLKYAVCRVKSNNKPVCLGFVWKVQEMYNQVCFSIHVLSYVLMKPVLTTESKTTYKHGEICLIAFEVFFPPVKWLVFPQVQQ